MARTTDWSQHAKLIRKAKAALEGKRAQLASQLSEIDKALSVFGGPISGNGAVGRGRPRGRGSAKRGATALREGSMGALIVNALDKSKAATGVAEVLAAIKKTGYKSKSDERTQRVMVNQTLSKLTRSGQVRKVGRGQYASSAA